MPFRPARVVALLAVVALITAAIQTCVPGTMSTPAGHRAMAGGQMECGQMNRDARDASGLHISRIFAPCCTSTEPVVLTKSNSVSAADRTVLNWMAPAVLAAALSPTTPVAAAASPPQLDSAAFTNTPRYVVFRTLLI